MIFWLYLEGLECPFFLSGVLCDVSIQNQVIILIGTLERYINMDSCSVYLTLLKADLERVRNIEELEELFEFETQEEQLLNSNGDNIHLLVLQFYDVDEAILGFEAQLIKHRVAFSKRWDGVQYSFVGGELHVRFDSDGNHQEYTFSSDEKVSLKMLIHAKSEGRLDQLVNELQEQYYIPSWQDAFAISKAI